MDRVTPYCPRCGQRPVLTLDNGRQSFCGTERCTVITWDQTLTAAELEASAGTVDLSGLEPPDPTP